MSAPMPAIPKDAEPSVVLRMLVSRFELNDEVSFYKWLCRERWLAFVKYFDLLWSGPTHVENRLSPLNPFRTKTRENMLAFMTEKELKIPGPGQTLLDVWSHDRRGHGFDRCIEIRLHKVFLIMWALAELTYDRLPGSEPKLLTNIDTDMRMFEEKAIRRRLTNLTCKPSNPRPDASEPPTTADSLKRKASIGDEEPAIRKGVKKLRLDDEDGEADSGEAEPLSEGPAPEHLKPGLDKAVQDFIEDAGQHARQLDTAEVDSLLSRISNKFCKEIFEALWSMSISAVGRNAIARALNAHSLRDKVVDLESDKVLAITCFNRIPDEHVQLHLLRVLLTDYARIGKGRGKKYRTLDAPQDNVVHMRRAYYCLVDGCKKNDVAYTTPESRDEHSRKVHGVYRERN